MDQLSLIAGVGLLALTLWDLFQGVVVPRPSPGSFRIARYVVRGSWRGVRWFARGRDSAFQDWLLGLYGPATAVLLLVVWLVGLILGYSLVLYALRDQLQPIPDNLGSTIYFAASSVLTLGSGDVLAVGTGARFIVTLAAATGLGVVALVVTFFFSLYASYQRREIQVIAIQAATGAPPSALALLETYAELDLVERLPQLFVTWQEWSAEVLDSHVAYPLLGYFRSSHDNLSWISALGSVLDAASLVVTTIVDVPRGDAELARRVGSHLVEDISNLGFRGGPAGALDRVRFDAACERLRAAGYRLEDPDRAWPAFEAARATYAARLEGMAEYWVVPAASWLGVSERLTSAVHRLEDNAVPAK